MKPDQKIVLFLTFITGMFAGGALYLTVFAPEYKAPPVEEKSQFLITGEMYGGCQRGGGCASFRLEADKSYQYLVGSERQEGVLPGAIVGPLFESLTSERLASGAASTDKPSCSSYVDGVDYRYEVTLEGRRYVLDTCNTTLGSESQLQQSFLEIWKYMESPTTTYPTIIEEGAGAWVIDRFQGEE